ncbi:diacylglycerol kinase family protein [Variovorax sp. N23]|uniref:diacylglycerol kinase family protein n=1 Tax=Variovorax sp. N23 TaxID=2980555 RepID=UPI0021C832B0|nr:diacylglycerol kinase family protein [Variovorax sp. N23]MCU4120789.1 diacylglycerol kinase family protein [Variovorax sp. N23]
MNAGVPGLMPVFESLDALATASQPPCLIVNPLSFRASRGLAEQAQAVAKSQGAEVVVVDGPASLTAAVETILARRQRHVMVLAGDGTVRAVIDQLASLPAGAWLPDLLVLPGGRTNLTAADLTPGMDALTALQRGLAAIAAKRWDAAMVERATLCIEQTPAPARYGLWVGAALIDGAIRRTHAHRIGGDGALRTGHLSTAFSLLRLAVLALRGRPGLSCPDLHIDAGALGRLQGKVSLLLATTLLHRRGLFDPYATRADGGMRLTAVSRHAAGFYRSLPRLLTGRFSRSMDVAHGFLSGGCAQAEITGLCGYSLDGEAYDTDPARPVVIRRGPSLRFFAT